MSSVTWAIGSSAYSHLSKNYSPFGVNFSRAWLALPVFILAVFITGGSLSGGLALYRELTPYHWAWLATSMVVSYGIGDALFLWSTRYLGIPGALAISSAYPLLTTLYGVLFREEVLSMKQALGILVAIGGMVLVILYAPHTEVSRHKKRSHALKGLALATGACLLWAMNSIAVSYGGQGISPFVGNSVRMLLALPISAAAGFLLARRQPLLLPVREFKKYWWAILFEAFGGSTFFMYGLAHSSLAIGSTLSALAPILAVPFAWAIGGEKVSYVRTGGVGMAVCGLWLLVVP
ncbi:DMT family transporter [bacterium]|jgi:drug/metabolite transporter (DMT)-like permease|nr:DMT family transporter [bacterium]